jgi:hypothetical protein
VSRAESQVFSDNINSSTTPSPAARSATYGTKWFLCGQRQQMIPIDARGWHNRFIAKLTTPVMIMRNYEETAVSFSYQQLPKDPES